MHCTAWKNPKWIKYNNIFNEGGRGYNPYPEFIGRHNFNKHDANSAVEEVLTFPEKRFENFKLTDRDRIIVNRREILELLEKR